MILRHCRNVDDNSDSTLQILSTLLIISFLKRLRG